MNILAPASNFESVKLMIDSGADEIYLGADEEEFSNYSFTGRGKLNPNGFKTLISFTELKEIITYAHNYNVRVNFLGNMPYFSGHSNNLEKKYLDYIEKGMRVGVDSVVVGDIGLLYAISKQGYDIDIHASLYFHTINKAQLCFLKDLGVKRTTLSYQVTIDDIKELAKAKIMDLEVVGYLGCSFYNGVCSLLHEYGEGVKDCFDPSASCKSMYIIKNESKVETCRVFDVEAGCSICSLKVLYDLGVKALKIVGRDRNQKGTAQIVKTFRAGLDIVENGGTLNMDSDFLPKWWKKLWCKNHGCKYRETNANYSYFIGSK